MFNGSQQQLIAMAIDLRTQLAEAAQQYKSYNNEAYTLAANLLALMGDYGMDITRDVTVTLTVEVEVLITGVPHTLDISDVTDNFSVDSIDLGHDYYDEFSEFTVESIGISASETDSE
jgi:hypothetical protein